MASNNTLHPSSHNCGNDINEEFVSPGTILAFLALSDSVVDKGNNPDFVAINTEESGRLSRGPVAG